MKKLRVWFKQKLAKFLEKDLRGAIFNPQYPYHGWIYGEGWHLDWDGVHAYPSQKPCPACLAQLVEATDSKSE